jgi:hypothetical protein
LILFASILSNAPFVGVILHAIGWAVAQAEKQGEHDQSFWKSVFSLLGNAVAASRADTIFRKRLKSVARVHAVKQLLRMQKR